MKKGFLLFLQDFPAAKTLGQDLILIYDEILARKSPEFKRWSKQFACTYPVKAGEALKEVDAFPAHIKKLTALAQGLSSRHLTIVVVGGGSVGDFGGFVASIFKRGVGLVHIPSTWLAAFDSAHGGKTALNVGHTKNQIGTFYPAQKTLLVRSLLMEQPASRSFEGLAELIKVALLQGGPFWKKLSQEKRLEAEVLWKYLPQAIQAKLAIVAKDPEEKSGHRHLLNLGHTWGHVLESLHQLPHGIAVNYGLDFALRWSQHQKIMTGSEYEKIMSQPLMAYLLSAPRDHLLKTSPATLKRMQQLLLSDKKKTQSQVLRFIFVKKPGHAVIREMNVKQILAEVQRQQKAFAGGRE